VVQLTDAMDVGSPPRPEDYGFGCFVKFSPEAGVSSRWSNLEDAPIALPWQADTPARPPACTVGIIYNSQLLNPQFLSNGPRLASEPDPLFTPDLINETRTLLGVVLLGELRQPDGGGDRPYGIQGIPPLVVPFNTAVHRMDTAEIRQFHHDAQDRPQFRYYNLLLRYGGSFATHLTEQVLRELVSLDLFPTPDQRALETLCREMAWKNTMGAMG